MATYRIEILLAGPHSLWSPVFKEKDSAEEELAEITKKIGTRDRVQRDWVAVNSGTTIVAARLEEKLNAGDRTG